MTKLWPCWFVFDDLLKSDLVGWLIWKIAKQTKCWPSWSFWWFADEAKRNLELTSLSLPVWLSRMAGSYFCKHSIPKELFAIIHIIQLKTRAIFEQRKAQEVLGEKQLSLSLIVSKHRVAQLVAAWQPGCEKMEREWENEEEMEREWGNEEEMGKE